MLKCNVLPIASDVGGVKEMLGSEYLFLVDTPHSVEEWVCNLKRMLELKKDEKVYLLSKLTKRMQAYPKRDFKLLLNKIFNSTNS